MAQFYGKYPLPQSGKAFGQACARHRAFPGGGNSLRVRQQEALAEDNCVHRDGTGCQSEEFWRTKLQIDE